MNGAVHALLDADDRLVAADPPLALLNTRAGGAADRLVLPPVLALARMARRLGVVIARPVRLADGDDDVEVWLRAEPDEDGVVRLTLADWRARPAAVRRHDAMSRSDEPDADPLLPANFAEPLRRALDRPVRRIVATAELLHSEDDPDVPQPYRDYARDIAQAGRHLQALLDDLVTLDGVGDPPDVEPIDLAEAARRAVDLLTVRAAEAEVRVVQSAGQAFAQADFRRTLQIAINLIANAINQTAAHGEVVVSVSGGTTARLTIDDNGPGVPADQRERIFDQFVRLEPASTAGSGLGLTICRRLARAMGGDVRASESPAGGARFTLTLPPVD